MMAPGAGAPIYGPARGSTTSSNSASTSAAATRPAKRFRSTGPKTTSSASACSTTGRRATSSSGKWRPLGPFLAKNFATTVSPWIVTMEALAPIRTAWSRPAGHPQPLGYLEGEANRAQGAIDIRLEVWLESARDSRRRPARRRACRGRSFRHQYWSIAQMVAHHTVGGCSLNSGRPVRQRHDLRARAGRGRRHDRAGPAAGRRRWRSPTASTRAFPPGRRRRDAARLVREAGRGLDRLRREPRDGAAGPRADRRPDARLVRAGRSWCTFRQPRQGPTPGWPFHSPASSCLP